MNTSHQSETESRRCITAFTLMELLAVVAIVGVLAVILLPAFRSMSASAKSASCVSNLRQSGALLLGYATENRQQVPSRWMQNNKWYGWDFTLIQENYVSYNTALNTIMGPRITSCPLSYGDKLIFNPDSNAYGMNVFVYTAEGQVSAARKTISDVDKNGNAFTQEVVILSALPSLTRTVLLADSFDKWVYDNLSQMKHQKSVFGENRSWLWMRHNSGANVLLADVHVERMKTKDYTRFFPKDIPGPYWPQPSP